MTVQRWVDRGGSGAVTVILVHGWGLDRKTWGPLRPYLEDHAEVVSYDQAGFGEAPWDGEHVTGTLERHAEELLELVRSIESGRVVLIGNSRGGMIAASAAAEHPDRLAALVLIDTPVRVTASEDFPDAAPRDLYEQLAEQLSADFAATIRGAADPYWIGDVPETSDTAAAREQIARAAGGVSDPSVAVAILRDNISDDIRGLLPSVEVPVLVLHGDRDPSTAETTSRLIAKTVQDGEVRIVENAGHVPQMTSPAQTAELILEFLRRRGIMG